MMQILAGKYQSSVHNSQRALVHQKRIKVSFCPIYESTYTKSLLLSAFILFSFEYSH